MAVSKVAKTVARKVIKKKPIKVNSNPNKTPAKGTKNPTKQSLNAYEINKELYKVGFGSNPNIKKQTIKINSSIPKRRGK